jgi:hypothetical protein
MDTDRIDKAVLALLQLTLHDGNRAWKGFDWDVLNRLCDQGFIGDPINKSKSVVLTEEGLKASRQLFEELFNRPQAEPLAANGQRVGDVNAALAFLSRQGGQAPEDQDKLPS